MRALVVLEEDPGVGSMVQAQPIALVHLAVGDESVDEVVCVEEGSSPADIARLADGPAGQAVLREAILRAHPGGPWSVVALEDIIQAEQLLGSAWLNYLRAVIDGR